MANSTIRDVARLADVSLGTISNYLNGNKRVSDATRAKIEAAIEKLEFVPNSAVRVLHGHPSHVVAFIVPDGGNPFFREIAKGIEDIAISRGHVVVTCNTEGEPARESHYAKALSEMRVRAAIAIASPTTNKMLEAVGRTGARGVIIGSAESDVFSSIVLDDRAGGRLAMDHILSLGMRRILFFAGPGATPQIKGRYAGYLDALANAGLDATVLRRLDAESSSPTDRSQAARKIIDVSSELDAVLCANDLLALALEAEAIRAGLSIPGDLAIVGYDDTEAAATAPIPLTTVHQPAYEIGRRAAELAFAGSDAVSNTIPLDVSLIARNSTLGTLLR